MGPGRTYAPRPTSTNNDVPESWCNGCKNTGVDLLATWKKPCGCGRPRVSDAEADRLLKVYSALIRAAAVPVQRQETQETFTCKSCGRNVSNGEPCGCNVSEPVSTEDKTYPTRRPRSDRKAARQTPEPQFKRGDVVQFWRRNLGCWNRGEIGEIYKWTQKYYVLPLNRSADGVTVSFDDVRAKDFRRRLGNNTRASEALDNNFTACSNEPGCTRQKGHDGLCNSNMRRRLIEPNAAPSDGLPTADKRLRRRLAALKAKREQV